MSLQLVDHSPEAAALRSAALEAGNELFTLSIEAGGLAGLLRLISGNGEDLSEQQGMAFVALADMAERIVSEINAIADRLGRARQDGDASAS